VERVWYILQISQTSRRSAFHSVVPWPVVDDQKIDATQSCQEVAQLPSARARARSK